MSTIQSTFLPRCHNSEDQSSSFLVDQLIFQRTVLGNGRSGLTDYSRGFGSSYIASQWYGSAITLEMRVQKSIRALHRNLFLAPLSPIARSNHNIGELSLLIITRQEYFKAPTATVRPATSDTTVGACRTAPRHENDSFYSVLCV